MWSRFASTVWGSGKDLENGLDRCSTLDICNFSNKAEYNRCRAERFNHHPSQKFTRFHTRIRRNTFAKCMSVTRLHKYNNKFKKNIKVATVSQQSLHQEMLWAAITQHTEKAQNSGLSPGRHAGSYRGALLCLPRITHSASFFNISRTFYKMLTKRLSKSQNPLSVSLRRVSCECIPP